MNRAHPRKAATLDDEVLVPNQPTGQEAFKDFPRSGRVSRLRCPARRWVGIP